MANIRENIEQIRSETGNAQLVVVSKYRSIPELREVLEAGVLDLGENRVQELVSKSEQLAENVRWHLIGHLQRNKVKQIVPFVHLIHSVDSIRLLNTIQSEAQKLKRTIAVLLQLHIAKEDSKFGFTSAEVRELLIGDFRAEYPNVRLRGMMGMATFTEDREQIRQEFLTLKKLYDEFQNTYEFDTLSMGMSNDYHLALECGSTMLRIGSKIFE